MRAQPCRGANLLAAYYYLGSYFSTRSRLSTVLKFCSGSSHKNVRSSDGEPGELVDMQVDQVGIVVLVVDL